MIRKTGEIDIRKEKITVRVVLSCQPIISIFVMLFFVQITLFLLNELFFLYIFVSCVAFLCVVTATIQNYYVIALEGDNMITFDDLTVP